MLFNEKVFLLLPNLLALNRSFNALQGLLHNFHRKFFDIIMRTWTRGEIIGLVAIVIPVLFGVFSGILTPEGRNFLGLSPLEANSANNQTANINSQTDVGNMNTHIPQGIKSPTPMASSTLSEPLSTPTVSPPRITPTLTPPPSQTPTIPSFKFEPIMRENILFDFSECKLANGNVTCTFEITNNGADENFRFYGKPLMYDDKGTKYESRNSQIGDSSREILLLRDVPVKATMTFDNVSKDISYVSRLFVKFAVRSPNRLLPVDLTDIALHKEK